MHPVVIAAPSQHREAVNQPSCLPYSQRARGKAGGCCSGHQLGCSSAYRNSKAPCWVPVTVSPSEGGKAVARQKRSPSCWARCSPSGQPPTRPQTRLRRRGRAAPWGMPPAGCPPGDARVRGSPLRPPPKFGVSDPLTLSSPRGARRLLSVHGQHEGDERRLPVSHPRRQGGLAPRTGCGCLRRVTAAGSRRPEPPIPQPAAGGAATGGEERRREGGARRVPARSKVAARSSARSGERGVLRALPAGGSSATPPRRPPAWL